MRRSLQKLFDIRQGELSQTLLSFSYIFLIIASLLIIKPVRNSLFLTRYGVQMLPYAFLLVAVFATIIIEFYTRLSKKIYFNRLIKCTLLASIISLVIFWVLLKINYQAGWFFFVIYIWAALFGAITTSQFWLLANYVFNARQAKRLFGFIGAGAISGGIAGGYLTRFLAPLIGTDNMMLICALFLAICIFLISKIWSRETQTNYTERLSREEKHRQGIKYDNPIKIISKSRHLTFISIIIGVGVIVANLVDYQYNAIASDIIQDKDKLTAFFGFWLSNLSIASLVIQMLFTGRFMKRFGVIPSLFLLPFGILIGAVSILFFPSLWSAIIIKVGDGSLKQSINKAGLELLIVPVPWQMKNQTKSFIDVFIDSVATGLGGLLLILVTTQFGMSISGISFIIIILIIIWFIMIRLVKTEYINSFRQAIEKRTLDLTQETTQFDDTLLVSYLSQTMDNANNKQLIYVLDLLENTDNPQIIPQLQQLLQHKSWEVRLKTLKIIKNYGPKTFLSAISDMIHDTHFEIKVEAIKYLQTFHKDSKTLHALLANSDYKISSAAILAAAELCNQDESFCTSLDFNELFDNFINQHCLLELKPKQIAFVKTIITKIIGLTRIKSFYPFLLNLLQDPNLTVVKAAIDSVGKINHTMFVPVLLDYLQNNTVRRKARMALSNYGNDLLPYAKTVFMDPQANSRIQLSLPKILSMINTPESAQLLIDHLESKNLSLRHLILKALNSLRTFNPVLKIDQQIIEDNLFSEAEFFYKHMQEYAIFSSISTHDHDEKSLNAQSLLKRVLSERIDMDLEKIFRLLGLIYPPQDIYNAYLAITSRKIDSNANAVEFLDNLLNNKLKKHILPIVEFKCDNDGGSAPAINTHASIHTHDDAIKSIFKGHDYWLKSVLLYYLINRNSLPQSIDITSLQHDQDFVLQETARLYQQ